MFCVYSAYSRHPSDLRSMDKRAVGWLQRLLWLNSPIRDLQIRLRFWQTNCASYSVFESSQLAFLFALFPSAARVICCSPARSALCISVLQIFLSLASAPLPHLYVQASGFHVPFAHILITKFRSPDQTLPFSNISVYNFKILEILVLVQVIISARS